MAQVKDSYDVSDVESGGGGTEPQPDMYDGKVVSITPRKQKSNGDPVNDLEVVVDLGGEYVRKWMYVQLDNPNSRWKLRELIDAVDAPPKGTIAQLIKKGEGAKVKVKIKAGTNQDGSYRGEIKNLFKPGDEVVDDEEAAALAEVEPAEYGEWPKEDLLAEIEERGLEKPAGRVTVEKLVAVLEAHDAEGDPDEPEDEAEDATFDIRNVDGFEDWDEWSSDDLKEYVKENDIAIEGRFSEAKARAAIEESVAASEGGEAADVAEGADGDDAATPTDEYDNFTDQELKDEIADRIKDGAEIKVAGRWTRDKAIESLRADDEANPF